MQVGLSYSNVTATLALFVALGGTSYAVATGTIGSREIRNNSVRSSDIRNHGIAGKDIRDGALTSRQVRNGTLVAADFSAGQLPAGPPGPPGPPGRPGDRGQPGAAASNRRVVGSPVTPNLLGLNPLPAIVLTNVGPAQITLQIESRNTTVGGSMTCFGTVSQSSDGSTTQLPPRTIPLGNQAGGRVVETWTMLLDGGGANQAVTVNSSCNLTVANFNQVLTPSVGVVDLAP